MPSKGKKINKFNYNVTIIVFTERCKLSFIEIDMHILEPAIGVVKGVPCSLTFHG